MLNCSQDESKNMFCYVTPKWHGLGLLKCQCLNVYAAYGKQTRFDFQNTSVVSAHHVETWVALPFTSNAYYSQSWRVRLLKMDLKWMSPFWRLWMSQVWRQNPGTWRILPRRSPLQTLLWRQVLGTCRHPLCTNYSLQKNQNQVHLWHKELWHRGNLDTAINERFY